MIESMFIVETKVKTIENDEQFLRQESIDVDFNDQSYKNEINLLSDFCKNNSVFAMAAVQIGIPKRIIYLKNTDLTKLDDNDHNEGKVIINPIIISKKGKTLYWEACASCLDNMGLVVRPYEMVIEYKDIYNNSHTEILTGFATTVFSHEYDHLNGVLHMDIAKKIKNMPQDERKEWRKTHDYEIVDKCCTYLDN